MPWTCQALSLLLGNLGQAGHTEQEAASCTPGAHSTSRMLVFAPGSIQWKNFGGFSACLSVCYRLPKQTAVHLSLWPGNILANRTLRVFLVQVSLLAYK